MRIRQVEVANFRKLLATRIELAKEKTVFVGANNSGKTTAMTVLRRFLVEVRAFTINDICLVHWPALDIHGRQWEGMANADEELPQPSLAKYLPHLDLWLEVGEGEMHYVQKLIPTLDWNSGLLGVRLQFEPTNPVQLQQDYIKARRQVAETLEAAKADGSSDLANLVLWPRSFVDFLDRRLGRYCRVQAYILDPAKLVEPERGRAKPQALPENAEALEGDPLEGLIRIDEISAQRGFGTSVVARSREDGAASMGGGRRLSTQLRTYYDNHLDWADTPDASDLKAMDALEKARLEFDLRLSERFDSALSELRKLGYPGISDPKLKIGTKLRLQDGLSHDSAVQCPVRSWRRTQLARRLEWLGVPEFSLDGLRADGVSRRLDECG